MKADEGGWRLGPLGNYMCNMLKRPNTVMPSKMQMDPIHAQLGKKLQLGQAHRICVIWHFVLEDALMVSTFTAGQLGAEINQLDRKHTQQKCQEVLRERMEKNTHTVTTLPLARLRSEAKQLWTLKSLTLTSNVSKEPWSQHPSIRISLRHEWPQPG